MITEALLVLLTVAFFVFAIASRRLLSSQQHAMDESVHRLGQDISRLRREVVEGNEGVVNAITLNSGVFQFPVPLGGPSIDSHHARSLTFLLQARKPKRILELGSGSSTVYISTILKKLGRSAEVHISIDHDLRFLNFTKELCGLNGVESGVRFEHCPLGKVESYAADWYLIPQSLKAEGPFDLIIIDGPPAYEAHLEAARLPALPELLNHLAADGVMILDDSNRKGEGDILEAWRRDFPSLAFDRRPEGKGHTIISRAPLF